MTYGSDIRSVLVKAAAWDEHHVRERPDVFAELEALCSRISSGSSDPTTLAEVDRSLAREGSGYTGMMARVVAQIIALHVRHALQGGPSTSYEQLVYNPQSPAIDAVCAGILEPLLEAEKAAPTSETTRKMLILKQKRASTKRLAVYWLYDAVAKSFASLHPEFLQAPCYPLNDLVSGKRDNFGRSEAAEILLYLTMRHNAMSPDAYEASLRDATTPEGQFRVRCSDVWQAKQLPGMSVLSSLRLVAGSAGDEFWPRAMYLSAVHQRLIRTAIIVILFGLVVWWNVATFSGAKSNISESYQRAVTTTAESAN